MSRNHGDDEILQLAQAVQQLQEMCKALIPIRDPHYTRLAEQQMAIDTLLLRWKDRQINDRR